MRWYIVTCNKTRHIIPAQLWLFKKYAPDVTLVYLDMKDYPLKDWCKNVLDCLSQVGDEYIVFGLDDYLPIAPIRKDIIPISIILDGVMEKADRLGLGWGCRKHEPQIEHDRVIEYTEATPYSASCQFSVWKTDSLRKVLEDVDGTPWQFEINGRCKTFALKEPTFRWIEESALSNRRPGKVNLLGLRPDDVNELVNLGFVKQEDIIYGWRGSEEFRKELAGDKYAEFYV